MDFELNVEDKDLFGIRHALLITWHIGAGPDGLKLEKAPTNSFRVKAAVSVSYAYERIQAYEDWFLQATLSTSVEL